MLTQLTQHKNGRALLALSAALVVLLCLLAPDIPSALLKTSAKRSPGQGFSAVSPQKNLRIDERVKAKHPLVAGLPVVVAQTLLCADSFLPATRVLVRMTGTVSTYPARAPPVSLL